MMLLHLLLRILPLCQSPTTTPEIPPLYMHQLPIVELRSFSNSSNCLLLFVPFVATVRASNLAIAIAPNFRKSLAALLSTRYTQLFDRSPQTDEHSSLRRPHNFSGSSPKNSCDFSISSTIFFRDQKKMLALFFCDLICVYSLEYKYYQVYVLCRTKQTTHA